MKIYDYGNEGNVFIMVNPKKKFAIRYDIHSKSMYFNEREKLDIEDDEETSEIPDDLKAFCFHVIFVAYRNPMLHDTNNDGIFQAFFEVIS